MTRLEIQSMLENTLGSRNVYYQPPSSIKINYPAIVYSLEGMTNNHASNGVYLTKKAYKVAPFVGAWIEIDMKVSDKELEKSPLL